MDRRFLSDAGVVAASREFVCIRLSTYESKEEAAVLKSIFIGRSGELENTVFALLTPGGEKIGRAGRSPEFAYAGPGPMAEGMKEIAARYPRAKEEAREFPGMKDLRLALNVASCDGLPLVLAVATSQEERARLESRMRPVAWSRDIAGRFIFDSVVDAKELSPISGLTRKSGFLVLQPDAYGVKGQVLLEVDPDASPEDLEKGLLKARALFKRTPKEAQSHIREGERRGIHWETAIPVTDPGPPGAPRK